MKKEMNNDKDIHIKNFQHKTLEERAKEYDEEIEHTEEYEWDEPEGRELW